MSEEFDINDFPYECGFDNGLAKGRSESFLRIDALEAEVTRYRHLGIQYLRWLSVSNADEVIEKDMCNPEMFEGSNLTARITP